MLSPPSAEMALIRVKDELHLAKAKATSDSIVACDGPTHLLLEAPCPWTHMPPDLTGLSFSGLGLASLPGDHTHTQTSKTKTHRGLPRPHLQPRPRPDPESPTAFLQCQLQREEEGPEGLR